MNRPLGQLMAAQILRDFQQLMPVKPGVSAIPRRTLSRENRVNFGLMKGALIEPVRIVATELRSVQSIHIHEDFGHLPPESTAGLMKHLNLGQANYTCSACETIPKDQRLSILLRDPGRTELHPSFMQSIELATFVSREHPGHLAIAIVERESNCLFWRMVSPGGRIMTQIIAIIEELHHLTGRYPRNIAFTTRHGVRMDKAEDPLRLYLERNKIRYLPTSPIIRVPFVGDACLYDYVDLTVRAYTAAHGRNWRLHIFRAFSGFNRVPDSDGLTPFSRFYQRIDARINLEYFREYEITIQDRRTIGRFVGYSADGLAYRFLLADENIVDTVYVNPVPAVDRTQDRQPVHRSNSQANPPRRTHSPHRRRRTRHRKARTPLGESMHRCQSSASLNRDCTTRDVEREGAPKDALQKHQLDCHSVCIFSF